jgi:carbonic anhydrase
MKTFAKRSLIVMVGLVVGSLAFGGVAAASDPVHWTYEGDEGPDHWGELSPDFAACSTGTEQSPVDIAAGATLNPADLVYNYQPGAVNIFNNGHTIQVNYDAGSSLELDNDTYQLLQFHFHAHSENTLAGQPSPMEMHLVHQNAAGGLAVVGVWLESGSENAAFAPVFDNLPPAESEPAAVAGATVDADELLPADRSYYRFNGSLTTPPCAEGVKWIMLSTPVELSADQLAAFTAIFDNNYRPVQPLNERTFLTSAQIAPESLPETGGGTFPGAALVMGVGALAVVTGVHLYRRQTAQ